MDNKALNDFMNVDYKSFADYLANMPPLELGAIGSIVGLLLTKPLTTPQQSSIGNFFELVGQAMLVVSAQQNVLNRNASAQFSQQSQNSDPISQMQS